MTSLITLPNDHLAVTIPEGITQFKLVNDASGKPFQALFGRGYPLPITELEGSYTIVSLGSEISEEQAGEIVEQLGYEFKDYGFGNFDRITALESFQSLLRSLSLDISNVLIVKENK